MLRKGDMNNSAGRSDAFLQRLGFRLATQHCFTGGPCIPIADTKRERTRKILKGIGVPATFGSDCASNEIYGAFLQISM